jgi:preprotein translocase subunit YajC
VNGGSLLILIALFGVLWLVMIRPQRARQQRQQQLIESVAPGDEVLTVGGLYGIVQEIDEEGDLVVEIADGIHVRLARRSVATVVERQRLPGRRRACGARRRRRRRGGAETAPVRSPQLSRNQPNRLTLGLT